MEPNVWISFEYYCCFGAMYNVNTTNSVYTILYTINVTQTLGPTALLRQFMKKKTINLCSDIEDYIRLQISKPEMCAP